MVRFVLKRGPFCLVRFVHGPFCPSTDGTYTHTIARLNWKCKTKKDCASISAYKRLCFAIFFNLWISDLVYKYKCKHQNNNENNNV